MNSPFEPAAQTLLLAGRTVTIREVRMRELQQVASICAPFFDAFDSVGDLAKARAESGRTSDTLLYRLLAEHADRLLTLATLLTDAPRDWLEQLPPDQFFVLAAQVVEVNAGFFIVRLFPALQNMAAGIGRIGSTTPTP